MSHGSVIKAMDSHCVTQIPAVTYNGLVASEKASSQRYLTPKVSLTYGHVRDLKLTNKQYEKLFYPLNNVSAEHRYHLCQEHDRNTHNKTFLVKITQTVDTE